MQLRTPFIMAPIKLGYSDGSGEINDDHIRFYRDRSHHVGAITPEPLYLAKSLREIPTQIGIDSDDKLPGLRRLTAAIHDEGAKVIAHLNHPGRMVNPKIPGNVFLSASARACENGGATPKRMDEQDMAEVTDLFVQAAIRAESAGFDFIELQLGHGYLLAQFLSPAVNDRSDEYGGSLENRMRFPLAVFDAVKEAVNLPINVRVSGEEMIPGGITLDETIALAQALEAHGAHAVHVSAGTICSTPPWFFQHMFVPKGKTWEFAAKIKEAVNIPVIFVGRINSAADVDKLIQVYHADIIALGRALVADPGFVGKYLGKIQEAIRPCLACSEGCLGGVRSGQGLGCVVNPLLTGTAKYLPPASGPKRIAVIGGGLAGMEAALTLKARGYDVVLYEKNQLGGQFNLAWLPPHKTELKELVDYYRYEINDKAIPIIEKEAAPEDIFAAGYDGVVVATGALPAVPPIKGLKTYAWAETMLEENLPRHKKVVIVGGGLIGIEVASKLVDHDNEVIIVEMLEEIARDMEMIEKKLTLKKLQMKRVAIYTQTMVAEVDGSRVILKGAEEQVIEDVDHIVMAAGMRSYRPLVAELDGKLPVYVIGDAREVSNAQKAIRDGFTVALTI